MTYNTSPPGEKGEWRPPSPPLHPGQFGETDAPFDLPPEKNAYYEGSAAAEEHKTKMEGMGVAERHEYMRGLREVNSTVPKPGDFDNPLTKDMPRPPAARRGRNPVVVSRQNAKRIKGLARKARGRR